tara:strand:+ start:530 stop:736 length:207 start_codon:yes stop_codon:yes gene_type:complete
MSKVFEHFKQWLEDNTPQHPSEMEFGPQEEPLSNCCGAEFGPPGYPDCDLCSKCGEHAGTMEDDDEMR